MSQWLWRGFGLRSFASLRTTLFVYSRGRLNIALRHDFVAVLCCGDAVEQFADLARSLARKVRELLDGVATAKHSHEVVS